MAQGPGPQVPPAGARRRRARRATPWREERMDEQKKDFAVSYAIESVMTGRGPAPRMNVEMPDRILCLPTAVFVVTHSAFSGQGPENPLQGTASPHEITFGVVCHEDEARTIALLAKAYNERAGESGGFTTPAMVAALLDQLVGVCGYPVVSNDVFFWAGDRIQECYGQETARAAVRAVRLESARMEREMGEDRQPIIHPIHQTARRVHRR